MGAWGLAFIALTAAVAVWRILDEERLLMRDLVVYSEYAYRVHYRRVPYLW